MSSLYAFSYNILRKITNENVSETFALTKSDPCWTVSIFSMQVSFELYIHWIPINK